MKKENKTQKWKKSKMSSRKKKSHVLLLINFPRELLESCFRFQYHGWWFFSRLCCCLFSFIGPLISIYSSSSSFIPLHPFLFYKVFVLFSFLVLFCLLLLAFVDFFLRLLSFVRSFIFIWSEKRNTINSKLKSVSSVTSTSIYNLLIYYGSILMIAADVLFNWRE